MKYGLVFSSFLLALSLVACGSDDDDDWGTQFADDFEDMFNSSGSIDDSRSSGSSSNSKNSSGSKTNSCSSEQSSKSSSSSEEVKKVIVPKTNVTLHYDSTRKATIGTGTHDDALISYTYRTVQVGPTLWLAENVRRSAVTAKCYAEKDYNCDTYAPLYRSASGLCPADFRLPKLEEWQELLKIAGGSKTLMSKVLWGADGESGGKDDIGFTMLPAGICTKGKCSGLGTEADFFAEKGDVRGYVTFKYGKDSLEWHTINNDDSTHLSIRCVQPATSFQKESEIGKVCEPASEVDVADGQRHFKCSTDSVWLQVLDSIPSSCASKDEDRRYLIYKGEYLCIAGKIRQLTTLETEVGRCREKNEGDTITYNNNLYVCQSKEWTLKKIEDVYGKCGSDVDPAKIVTFMDKEYRCRNAKWDTLSTIEQKAGVCTPKIEGDTVHMNSSTYYYTYICKNSQWKTCQTVEEYLGKCTRQRSGSVATYLTGSISSPTKNTYICDDSLWRAPNKIEARQGFCTAERENEVVFDSNFYYVCKRGIWSEPSIDEFPVPCDVDHEDTVYRTKSHWLVCDMIENKWRERTTLEQNIGLCTKAKEGKKATSNSRTFYQCKNRSWVTIDSLLYYLGDCSANENYKAVKTHKSKDYYCNGTQWIVATLNDVLGTCTFSVTQRDTARYKDTLYVCYEAKWQKATAYNVMPRCNTNNKGAMEYNFMNHTHYVCDSYSWDIADMNDIETCTASKYGVVKKMPKDDNREFVCSDWYPSSQKIDHWRQLSALDSLLGACSPANHAEVKNAGKTMQICWSGETSYSYHSWVQASKGEAMDYNCASASSGTKIRYATQNNICDGNGGWSVETGTVSIGGVTHKTVELAGMTILAENVKTSTSSSSCFEGNNNHSCTHGRLYTYAEASTICPTGWHLLDSAEYKTIYDTAYYYSGHLYSMNVFSRESGAWQSFSAPHYDEYGINIFGTGYCSATGNCEMNMREAYIWLACSSETSTTCPARKFTDQRAHTTVFMDKKSYLGVRCVKDR